MCALDKYKNPPKKIRVKKYYDNNEHDQKSPSVILKSLKFASFSMLIIYVLLSEGIVACDRKWYEWVIGAVLFIVIGIPLIMFLTFLFYKITGIWPV